MKIVTDEFGNRIRNMQTELIEENRALRALLLDALYLFRGAIPEGAEYDPDGNKWLAETKAILKTE